jgi:hypothetical protein
LRDLESVPCRVRERRYRVLRWLVAGGAGIQQMRLAGRRGMATMCKTLQSLYAVMRTILTISIILYLARRTSSAKIHLVQLVESPSPECSSLSREDSDALSELGMAVFVLWIGSSQSIV